jgi:hypothetical protein
MCASVHMMLPGRGETGRGWAPHRFVVRDKVVREARGVEACGVCHSLEPCSHGGFRMPLFVDKLWKPVHISEGLIPPAMCAKRNAFGDPLEAVVSTATAAKTHWVKPDGAVKAFEKAFGGKVDPGLRLSSEPVATGRLRRRAHWANALQHSLRLAPGLLGPFLSGRWTPDLTLKELPDGAGYMADAFGGEVKFLGGGISRTTPPKLNDKGEPLPVIATTCLRVGTRDGQSYVYPELVAKLATYACFRRRDAALVAALRSRAQEWVKPRNLYDCDVALALPMTVALASRITTIEASSSKALDRVSEVAVGGVALPRGWWKRGGL